MGSRGLARRLATAVAAAVLMAGAITAASPGAAMAVSCQSWVGGQPPSPDPTTNQFNAVTVLSPCNAWAVGSRGDGNVIEHFDGGSWKVVPSPQPAIGSFLGGIAAVSPANIWAVGGAFGATGDRDLVMHWNGRSWSRVPCPSPGQSPRLGAVGVVSARDIWAVGVVVANARARTLIMHWNGRAWSQVKSPNPGFSNGLQGLTVVSASDAWAAGTFISNNRDHTLILHWNGRTWSQVKSPDASTHGEFLGSMAAASASSAWVVGSFTDASDVQHPLILHWNGRTWARMASPRAGGLSSSVLEGVAAARGGSAWAVGSSRNDTDTMQNVVILHWNGSTWTAQRGPQPGTLSELFAVSASSGSNAWAVGDYIDQAGVTRNLAFHCC